MKAFVSLVIAVALLDSSAGFAQSSRNARENAITAQLNREQLAEAQQAEMPPPSPYATAPAMTQPDATGRALPPGARCFSDNPSCTQQLDNPAVNSPSQLRLYHAQ